MTLSSGNGSKDNTSSHVCIEDEYHLFKLQCKHSQIKSSDVSSVSMLLYNTSYSLTLKSMQYCQKN